MNENEMIALEREAMYAMLDEQLAPYLSADYEGVSSQFAARDRLALRRLENDWKEHRRTACEAAKQEFDSIAAAYAVGLSRIEALIKKANDAVHKSDALLRSERMEQLHALLAPILLGLTPLFTSSRAFVQASWMSRTIKDSLWRSEATQKAEKAREDVRLILQTGGKHTAALIERYAQTMQMDAVMEYRKTLDEIDASLPQTLEASAAKQSDCRRGVRTYRVEGTLAQLAALSGALSLVGVDAALLDEDLPMPPSLITCPGFDSFVAVDLETTGSLGSRSGDGPAQITEIGAVRVEDGVIVDRMSMLCNPNRPITPFSSALTHITNEMVKDAPPVADAIAALVSFAGGLPLVGHDLWHCDMPLLVRAANSAGIRFSPACFDTLLLATELKEKGEFPGLSLEALADHFSIAHDTLHRARCDAEVSAKLYFALKALQI